MSDTPLSMVMLFHFDSGITLLREIIDNDLVDIEALDDWISEKKLRSDSVHEERLWSAVRGFLQKNGDVLGFPPDLKGPDT